MFMDFVMGSISGTTCNFSCMLFFFPPAGWNFKQIQRWNIYTLLLRVEFWQTFHTHFWAYPSSTFKWVETTKYFFPLSFSVVLFISSCWECVNKPIYMITSCVPASLSLFQVFRSYQVKKIGKRSHSSQSGTNVISLNQVQSLKHQTTIFGGNYSDGINIALMWEGWVMYLTFSLKLHRTTLWNSMI